MFAAHLRVVAPFELLVWPAAGYDHSRLVFCVPVFGGLPAGGLLFGLLVLFPRSVTAFKAGLHAPVMSQLGFEPVSYCLVLPPDSRQILSVHMLIDTAAASDKTVSSAANGPHAVVLLAHL